MKMDKNMDETLMHTRP